MVPYGMPETPAPPAGGGGGGALGYMHQGLALVRRGHKGGGGPEYGIRDLRPPPPHGGGRGGPWCRTACPRPFACAGGGGGGALGYRIQGLAPPRRGGRGGGAWSIKSRDLRLCGGGRGGRMGYPMPGTCACAEYRGPYPIPPPPATRDFRLCVGGMYHMPAPPGTCACAGGRMGYMHPPPHLRKCGGGGGMGYGTLPLRLCGGKSRA